MSRSTLETLALTYAHELRRLLDELHDLPRHGPGSDLERASDLTDQLIECLEPNAFDGTTAWGEPVNGTRPRNRFEIRQMLEAGVSISDCASYFGASEAAVLQLVGGRV
jgi:hypothetical protein